MIGFIKRMELFVNRILISLFISIETTSHFQMQDPGCTKVETVINPRIIISRTWTGLPKDQQGGSQKIPSHGVPAQTLVQLGMGYDSQCVSWTNSQFTQAFAM